MTTTAKLIISFLFFLTPTILNHKIISFPLKVHKKEFDGNIIINPKKSRLATEVQIEVEMANLKIVG